MVCGTFSHKGKLPICFIITRTNSMKYNELLEDVLVQYMEENFDKDFIFQQDNAFIHVSKQSQEWFQQKFIPLQHAVLIVTLLKISEVYQLLRYMLMDVNSPPYRSQDFVLRKSGTKSKLKLFSNQRSPCQVEYLKLSNAMEVILNTES